MWMHNSAGKRCVLLGFELCEKTENAEVEVDAAAAILILFYTVIKLLFS